ncbi:HDOD domain-containing protein [bacterium]|nr:HDOD domain-containing protein [bacterium]
MYLKVINELGNIDQLPTLPTIVLRINSVLSDPRSTARTVADLIAEDMVLTTRILKLVNSAYYGVPRQVTTLSQAVVILGFREVKNLVLGAKIFDLFQSSFKKIKKFFDVNLLWQHSLGCATIAKRIARLINYPDPESLFIAGLIHDIGKIVEIKCLTDYMEELFKMVQQQNIFMWEAEQLLWNITHAEIGKVMVDMWDFPPLLEKTVAYHHNPHLAAEFAREAAIIHIADSICRELHIGSGGDNLVPDIDPWSWDIVGMNEQDKQIILDAAVKDVEELLPVFS